tara:strand:+ start:891 stop:1379 length:489 start_codon:yes stop_codon:yes gene_type:complete
MWEDTIMVWYGIGKKTRFKNKVLEDMEFLFKSYGTEAIGADGALLKRLNEESAAMNQKSDATFVEVLLHIFIHQVDAKLDEMVDMKLTPRQGSLYCFSLYIQSAYESNTLELDGEDSVITTALMSIWQICHHHLVQGFDTYKDVVIGKDINPFPDFPFETYK